MSIGEEGHLLSLCLAVQLSYCGIQFTTTLCAYGRPMFSTSSESAKPSVAIIEGFTKGKKDDSLAKRKTKHSTAQKMIVEQDALMEAKASWILIKWIH